MKNFNLRVVESFVHWHLNQKTGKNGRVKKGTIKTTSLRTFWDSVRLLYGREILADINWKVERNTVSNVSSDPRLQIHIDEDIHRRRDVSLHLQLVDVCYKEFNLSAQSKANRPMLLEDLKLEIETTLGSTEKSFKLGEARILAVLFLLLVAPAGSRPDSILQIQHRHLKIALYKPKDGPVQLMVWVELEHTKSYRGQKDV